MNQRRYLFRKNPLGLWATLPRVVFLLYPRNLLDREEGEVTQKLIDIGIRGAQPELVEGIRRRLSRIEPDGAGTIWLDARKTSPYAFYQFWLGTADADVYKFLRYFTFLSVEEIARIEEEDNAREGRPEAQRILAKEVTSLVHGAEGLAAAERITEALFAGEASALSADDLNQLALDGLPTSTLDLTTAPPTLTQLLSESGMVSSGKQVKDALKNNAVTINGVAVQGEPSISVESCFSPDNALHGRYWIVRLGKKKYHLFTAA